MSVATGLSGVIPDEAFAQAVDDERWSHLGRLPLAVVSPGSAREAAALLRWATREGVTVLPAGSSRGCDALRDDAETIVLTSERLSGLEIYEPADLTFTAGAGTSMAEVGHRLAEHGQWLPFDPPNVDSVSLGGLVASGDSGPLRMGYGDLRNHVLGATVVTGDGRILRLGGRVVKNVAGFDLLKPIVGSRGRLAFLTNVCMRAFPEPAVELRISLSAAAPADLLAAALAVGTAPILPVACVIERERVPSSLGAVGAAGGACRLVVRLHGAEATVQADRRTLEGHVGETFEVVSHGARRSADSGGGAESTSDGRTARGGRTADTEVLVSVRPSRLGEALPAIEALDPIGLQIDTYAARARIRVTDFPVDGIRSLRERVESLGGALSIQHAPSGADRSVASRPTDAQRELQDGVARVFDPGSVFAREVSAP